MIRGLVGKLKTVRPRIGKNLPQVLSRTLVKDWYAAISELVCNSYDADAERVEVDLDSGLGVLTINDDGSGMDQKGLEDFFRLGDSSKLEEPISPIKKRKRVGKYGIATVLLQYLGESFSVESVKDGRKYVIDEGVVEGDVDVKSHPVSRKSRNGTHITIRDLRFDPESEQFKLNKLYGRLQWEVPNQPDFDVFVNGQLVKKRGLVAYAATYQVKKDIGSGVVTGRIYYSRSKQQKLGGVRIYVNNRAVGDPSMFDLSSISRSLIGRVQGEIHADFLEDLITLDRSSFQDDERLDKTKEAVIEALHGIRQDLENGERSRVSYYQRDQLYSFLESAMIGAQEQLSKRLRKNITLILGDSTQAGQVARFDSDSNTIYLNAQNKMFTFLKRDVTMKSRKHSEIYLRRAFLIASALALTDDETKEKGFDKIVAQRISETFSSFDGIARIANRHSQESFLIPLKDVYLNQFRLYDHHEVSYLTGRPANVIRLLHICGALRGTHDHLFSKSSIERALKPLEGYISCVEVVDDRYSVIPTGAPRGNTRVLYTKPRPTDLDLRLKEERIADFGLINVGIRHPMFWVPDEQRDAFSHYVKQHGLHHGDGSVNGKSIERREGFILQPVQNEII